MRRKKALEVLRKHWDEISQFGVTSLRLFGSVARDEAVGDSDVDLLVGFETHPASLNTCSFAFISRIFLDQKLI